jgi:hypothetical protein
MLPMQENEILSLKDVMRISRVHRVTVLRWIKVGILPDRRLPGTKKHWFLQSDLLPKIATLNPNDSAQ